jgi:hypothetical protein
MYTAYKNHEAIIQIDKYASIITWCEKVVFTNLILFL